MLSISEQKPKDDGWKLALGAVGVVFGDIGTSPLYALKESFSPDHGIALSQANVLGILSLVFWSLTLVVAVKYLGFIMRANRRGEGGVTALLALLMPRSSKRRIFRNQGAIILLGLFGAGLICGDGIITPAISVLSAVEGLEVAAPALRHLVIPVTVAILFGLFAIQSSGTAQIGAIFGPVMLLWFLTLAATGLPWIASRPDILYAMDPRYAVSFLLHNGRLGFLVLSSVVLCITGAEALYADMGHFGGRPIRLAWYAVAFPALLLNYFGQGALVLTKGPEVLDRTFYGLVSGWLVYPLIGIATVATIIASQALITGAFSLSQQVIQLGFMPRLTVRHTSRTTEGQIFVPKVNAFLAVACITLVLYFPSSSALAGAYGIAVTGTMAITTILFFLVTRYVWKWKLLPALAVATLFLVVDSTFLLANLNKILAGGWVPIAVATALVILMTTWRRGRQELAIILQKSTEPLEEFIARLGRERPLRVAGTAVFMTLNRNVAPSALVHHYNHTQVLHERIMLLSILTSDEPETDPKDRVRIVHFSEGFVKVVAMYGHMETPNVLEVLKACESAGLPLDYARISFFLGREAFLSKGDTKMAKWRKRLFVLMSKNARPATEFFGLPADQVIEIGLQVHL